ncbi:MAG: helix-turn-helix domain-containing protein [Bacteriovorax sp.]|jgi:cytoskeletal protein RodZ
MRKDNIHSVGQFLKSNRENAKISVREMSSRTKIRIAQIIDLENDEFAKLPSITYVMGFVKSICAVLGIDSKVPLEILQQHIDRQEYPLKEEFIKQSIPKLSFEQKSLFLKKSALLLVALPVIALIFYLAFKANGEKRKELAVVKSKLNQQSAKEITRIEPIKLESSKPAKLAMINISIVAVGGASWMAYKIDEQPIVKFTLQKGRNLKFKGQKIRLLIGNYKALRILRDSVEVVIKNKSKSLTANLIFPENLEKEYKAPFFVFTDDGAVFTRKQYKEKRGDI